MANNPVRDLIDVTPGTVSGKKPLVPNINGDIGDLGILSIARSIVGGDSGKGMDIDIEVLAGNGMRQGGVYLSVNRASDQDFTWDGNPDCGLKIQVNQRAANADNEGAVRGIDISARNRGTNCSWVNGINVGVRNDSGKITYQLIGMQTRCENYGTVNTEILGLDVNMSSENDTGTPVKYGIQVRNTDASGMTACDAVIHVKHTSTNGFTAAYKAAAVSGDGVGARTGTPGTPAYALLVDVAGTLHYVPAYTAAQFAAS